MRVLVVTVAVASHLNLVVPTAWALRTAGHDVRVASQPNLMEAIGNAGLTGVPAGAALGEVIPAAPGGAGAFGVRIPLTEDRPEVLAGGGARAALVEYTERMAEFMSGSPMLDDLLELAEDWRPDLVLWDAYTLAGGVFARIVGAASVRLLSSQDYWARMHQRVLSDPRCPDDPLGDYLGAKLAPHGVEFDHRAVVGDLTLDPMPPWMRIDVGAYPVRYRSMRFVPYHGRAVVPPWLTVPPARPRICLTLGQTWRNYADENAIHGGGPDLAELLEAVALPGTEVVATLDPAQVRSEVPVPRTVRLFGFVPLEVLAPTCVAVVHHGGYGTVGSMLVHGVPQLVLPGDLWGERDLSRAIAAQGVGLDGAGTGPADITAALHALIDDPRYRAAARREAERIRETPAPHDVVGELEALVADREPVGGGSGA
ncbi:nucleotide disphospho-sugar-binding domain-containing protein [Pseudonocardia sp. NPDC046786]|uniref:nucleotide disphospho-sugar-binding domain-containing protein n=1 Tax=Pseudonocardia sp. NPDC046786 TaxID=3155471 RepID=UPI0033E8F0C4